MTFLDQLERDLVVAARRQATPRRKRLRTPLLGAVLALTCAGGAAAGTLTVLRGSPLPVPVAAPPEQVPEPGTSRLSEVRAPDPDGGAQPPWSLRIARSRAGLVCSTVGQVVEGELGIVGLDGRFREQPLGAADSCGIPRSDGPTLIGARVFEARRRADVRTIVSGVVSADLDEVVVETDGRRQVAERGPDGTFALALRGYPEDLSLAVEVRAGGRTTRHLFGRDPYVTPDPARGPAWRVEAYAFGTPRGARPSTILCVRFLTARRGRKYASSQGVCGDLGGRARRGWFGTIRRQQGRNPKPRNLSDGFWNGLPARTAAWGAAGDDVARVELVGPGADRRVLNLAPGARTFLAVLPADVDPGSVALEVTFHDGRRERTTGDHALVPPPDLRGRP
jgi:hypothetical protein